MQVAPRIVVHSCPLLTIYPRCCPRHATDMPQMFLFQQTFRNSSFKRNMGLWFFVKLEGDRASMCISMCHAKAHVLTELMQLSRGYIWLPYLRISRRKPPEAVSKKPHTLLRSNSVQWTSLLWNPLVGKTETLPRSNPVHPGWRWRLLCLSWRLLSSQSLSSLQFCCFFLWLVKGSLLL